ncbi:uncharacterized protein METZ01_LOCUS283911 [marine metagenome]|uniref:Uncharacterized protein n=1 Tax=marine metagenome TaxID=408172 RepID=A0A382L7Q9_9ZZZZ
MLFLQIGPETMSNFALYRRVRSSEENPAWKKRARQYHLNHTNTKTKTVEIILIFRVFFAAARQSFPLCWQRPFILYA